jgi:hypothetical protein
VPRSRPLHAAGLEEASETAATGKLQGLSPEGVQALRAAIMGGCDAADRSGPGLRILMQTRSTGSQTSRL